MSLDDSIAFHWLYHRSQDVYFQSVDDFRDFFWWYLDQVLFFRPLYAMVKPLLPKSAQGDWRAFWESYDSLVKPLLKKLDLLAEDAGTS